MGAAVPAGPAGAAAEADCPPGDDAEMARAREILAAARADERFETEVWSPSRRFWAVAAGLVAALVAGAVLAPGAASRDARRDAGPPADARQALAVYARYWSDGTGEAAARAVAVTSTITDLGGGRVRVARRGGDGRCWRVDLGPGGPGRVEPGRPGDCR